MITILGLGFVGLTTGLGFSKKGFKTYGIDINQERLKIYQKYLTNLMQKPYQNQ